MMTPGLILVLILNRTLEKANILICDPRAFNYRPFDSTDRSLATIFNPRRVNCYDLAG